MSTVTQRSPEVPAPATHSGSGLIRVMVVDDHPAVRTGLVQLLEREAEFSVACVCVDAEEARIATGVERIDVAVVDYQLPGHNGLWLCRQLKQQPRPPRVVIFSAFANDLLAACCVVAEADAVLSKGMLGSELCDAVRSAAHGARPLPAVPEHLAELLRCRLDDREQMLFGMLLAGIPRAEICRVLEMGPRELGWRLDTVMGRLERLPGESTKPLCAPGAGADIAHEISTCPRAAAGGEWGAA